MIKVLKVLRKLLDSKNKTLFFITFVLIFIGSFFEMIGISLVIPFVSAIVTPDQLLANKYVQFLLEIFDFITKENIVAYLAAILIFVYVVKNIYLGIIYYFQYKLIYGYYNKLSCKMIKKYLYKPYEMQLNDKTGDMIRKINTDTSYVANVFIQLMSLMSNLMLAALLVFVAFLLNWQMTLLAVVILVSLMAVSRSIIASRLRKIGSRLQICTSQMLKWITQSVSGNKEIKVAQKEDFFYKQFEKYSIEGYKILTKNGVFTKIPSLVNESVCIGGILLVLLIYQLMGMDMQGIIPTLAAFAMVIVKLLPTINACNSAYNAIMYYSPSLDMIADELKHTVIDPVMKNTRKGIKEFGSLDLIHVSYAYPDTQETIFDNACMQIKAGEMIGIVGKSGAGKTTLVDLILGLLKPQKGRIELNNKNISECYDEWLSMVQYIPQTIFMLDDSIRANVAFGEKQEDIDDNRVNQALKDAMLLEFIKQLPDGMNTNIGERGTRLSGGQRQRLGIARALYCNPQVLVFDEATSALDHETEAAIMESINYLYKKKTMIIIAHRLETIKNCDIVYKVENKQIGIDKNIQSEGVK